MTLTMRSIKVPTNKSIKDNDLDQDEQGGFLVPVRLPLLWVLLLATLQAGKTTHAQEKAKPKKDSG
jgi:hypothetical protein